MAGSGVVARAITGRFNTRLALPRCALRGMPSFQPNASGIPRTKDSDRSRADNFVVTFEADCGLRDVVPVDLVCPCETETTNMAKNTTANFVSLDFIHPASSAGTASGQRTWTTGAKQSSARYAWKA